MPVTLTIQEIPSGSQLVETISGDEPDDLNDFSVLILLDANGTGLTESDITFSTGASLVELTGANSVWQATIRPPETAGTVTITVAANAFTEGNAETSQDIEVVTNYPDTDAETPTLLFNHSNLNNAVGLTVSPSRIIASRGGDTTGSIVFFTHAGVQQTAETLTSSITGIAEQIEYFNDTLLIAGNQFYRSPGRFSLVDLSEIERYAIPSTSNFIAHTRLGVIGIVTSNASRILYIQPYGTTVAADRIEHQLPTEFGLYKKIAHQDDLLYMTGTSSNSVFALSEINDADGATYIQKLNINRPSGGMRDMAIYRDTLYMLGVNNGNIYTLNIRPYRPLVKNTKTTIYPVFANEGDTLPLSQFCPDAKTITFATGFDKPTFLSINAIKRIGDRKQCRHGDTACAGETDGYQLHRLGGFLILSDYRASREPRSASR